MKNEKICPRCKKPFNEKYVKCAKCRKYDLDKHMEIYRRKKEKGLCVKCGNPLDREGSYCRKCSDDANQSRKFYQELGICPVCRVNRIMGEDKSCFECRAKLAISSMDRLNRNREAINERERINSKKRVALRKEKGICTICGKRKSTNGLFSCQLCRTKQHEWKVAHGYIKNIKER